MTEQFDPNAFENQQESDKAAKIKEKMSEPIDMFKAADGKEYAVTGIDAMSHQFRRMAVEGLKVVDPEGYDEYRKMKYAGGPNPDLATRKAAYIFAATRFIEKSYSIPGC